MMLARKGSDSHLEFVRAHLNSSRDPVRKNAQYAWVHRFAAVERRLRGD